MNIDKDINRCKELIKAEHSNWIGMSNQDAIENVLSDRETWKKIAEKLAGDLEMFITAMINNEEIALNKDRIFLALNTNQSIKSLIIEEARKEVEKDV